ncbi:MAG: hypothetical protein MUC42_12225 [Bryobacter sp.]|nr:hypothetical protein [Bryobacter sp.]
MQRRDWIRIAAATAGARALGAEERRLPAPRPHPEEAALAQLIERIKTAVKQQNTAALEALMGPEFRVEFDVGKGPAAFRRHWKSNSPQSPLWGVLNHLFALPGYFYSDTLFAVPYTVARFPIDLDPLSHVVAVSEDVPLLAQPQAGAAKVGAVNHGVIVELAEPLQPPVLLPADRFLELKHPEHGRCYVAGAGVYHPAAHRAFFEKRKGRWVWISLAAATLADPPELLHRAKRS